METLGGVNDVTAMKGDTSKPTQTLTFELPLHP
jgi:hypothetical protein